MSDEETTVWPHHELGKKLSNWGRWGDGDEVGTLNLVTPEKRIEAATMVKTGKIVDLGMPFDKSGPWTAGGWRNNPQHVMTLLPSDSAGSPDGMIAADDMVVMGLQAATQWDGLAHVGYGGFFYNGVPAAAVNNFQGASKNAFPKVLPHLISRGVLLDVARVKGVDRLPFSYEITSEDLSAAEERQGVQVRPGDILLLRTGHYKYFLEGDRESFNGQESGPGLDAAQWFSDKDIAALALDNWACEVYPTPVPGSTIPFHQVVIRDMGLTIGEMFNLETLADDCEDDGVWEGMFSGVGLNVTGSVGSPLTPMFVK